MVSKPARPNHLRVVLIGLGILVLSIIPVQSQLTFNPTAGVTLGGSSPGSVIGVGTNPQIVRTTTFFFNGQGNLPRTRTMTFDTGTLNIGAITAGARLFETNIVVSASTIAQAMTARIGHTVVSLTQTGATLTGTIEATTVDPLVVVLATVAHTRWSLRTCSRLTSTVRSWPYKLFCRKESPSI